MDYLILAAIAAACVLNAVNIVLAVRQSHTEKKRGKKK